MALRVSVDFINKTNALALEILEQDEEDRALTESGYKRFTASNGFVISSETYPDIIPPNILCIRGVSKHKDNERIVYMFKSNSERCDYLNRMLDAIIEFNNRPKTYKVKVRKVKRK